MNAMVTASNAYKIHGLDWKYFAILPTWQWSTLPVFNMVLATSGGIICTRRAFAFLFASRISFVIDVSTWDFNWERSKINSSLDSSSSLQQEVSWDGHSFGWKPWLSLWILINFSSISLSLPITIRITIIIEIKAHSEHRIKWINSEWTHGLNWIMR